MGFAYQHMGQGVDFEAVRSDPAWQEADRLAKQDDHDCYHGPIFTGNPSIKIVFVLLVVLAFLL